MTPRPSTAKTQDQREPERVVDLSGRPQRPASLRRLPSPPVEPDPPPPPKPARRRKPLAITIAVVGILALVVGARFVVTWLTQSGVYFERERLLARTSAVASSLDIAQIRQLKGKPDDDETAGFKRVVTQLRKVQDADPDIRFCYLMRRQGDAVVFTLDTTNPSSDDYSPPGEVYEEASPELVHSFVDGKPFVEGPTVDRWGTWISALVPVRDPANHKVLAVLGMDVSATRWNIVVAGSRIATALAVVLLSWLVIFLAFRFNQRR
jgi:hypothetical protein